MSSGAPTPRATAQAASTCGNFGPGFDVFSLALDLPGDTVTLTDAPRDEVRVTGAAARDIPTEWKANCAAAAVDHLRARFGIRDTLLVEIEKSVPPGSGLGSSASSSAAGALAFAARYRGLLDVTPADLLDAAAAGERAGAGGDHRDDVAAALFGGLVVVSPAPHDVIRLKPPRAMKLAVARAHVKLETKKMRALLPADFARRAVVGNLAAVARMVDAVHRGDVPAIGRALEDNLATPHRKTMIPYFDEVREAALDAGALGFAIAGSGPAVFGLAEGERAAADVLRAMLEVYGSYHAPADGFVAGCREEVSPVAPLLH